MWIDDNNEIDTPDPVSMAFLGRRARTDYNELLLGSTEELKSNSKCSICGEIGHWYRDRKEYFEKMKHKRGKQ